MMTCKCGNEKCLGFQLLHPVELLDLEERKQILRERYGDVDFELKPNPSLFTQFQDLHVVSK